VADEKLVTPAIVDLRQELQLWTESILCRSFGQSSRPRFAPGFWNCVRTEAPLRELTGASLLVPNRGVPMEIRSSGTRAPQLRRRHDGQGPTFPRQPLICNLNRREPPQRRARSREGA
jgi:hypothetical protein